MVRQTVPTLKVGVVGIPESGKVNFINGLLHYYPPYAEICRKNDTIYFMYQQDKDFKIQLHNVSSIKSIANHFYDDMDVVFFCYAANNPESYISVKKGICFIEISPMKGVRSFLVADTSNVDNRQDIANSLAEDCRELKECFGIKQFVQCSFVDKESTYNVFQSILDEVAQPKLKKPSASKLCKESPMKLPKICLAEKPPCSLLGPYLPESCSICHHGCSNSGVRCTFEYSTVPNSLLNFSEEHIDQKIISGAVVQFCPLN